MQFLKKKLQTLNLFADCIEITNGLKYIAV